MQYLYGLVGWIGRDVVPDVGGWDREKGAKGGRGRLVTLKRIVAVATRVQPDRSEIERRKWNLPIVEQQPDM